VTPEPQPSTSDAAYAQRLQRLSARGGRLRKVIDPQIPYRWNLRRMRPGFVLDIGCGIGRNLGHLNGHGVGVDHNPTSVAACVSAGLTAFSPDDFEQSRYAASETFDTVLLAHVIEHMTEAEAHELISTYLAYLRPGGRVILITPQERGQASDSTHVRFIDHTAVHGLAGQLGLGVVALRSFPLPRVAGRVFTYNETVAVLA